MLLYQSKQIIFNSDEISISEPAIVQFCRDECRTAINLPRWDAPFMYQGPADRVTGWFLAFNAINYSFWPDPGKRRWHTEIEALSRDHDG